MNHGCKRFNKLDFIKMKNSALGKSLLKRMKKWAKNHLSSREFVHGICEDTYKTVIGE